MPRPPGLILASGGTCLSGRKAGVGARSPARYPMMKLPAGVLSGGVVAVASLAYAMAYAALIFSGAGLGEVELAYGIGAALLTTASAALFTSLFSGLPFANGGLDTNACAVLAAIAANAAPFVVLSPDHIAVVNVLALLSIATIATGLALILLGSIGAGHWIRFIPVPVVGGFLAAAGWLIVYGAARVASGTPLTLSRLNELFHGESGLGLAAAALFAVAIMQTRRLWKHPLALPAVLVAGVAVTLGVLALLHVPIEAARAQGWFFTVPAETSIWFPWSLADLGAIYWDVVRDNLLGILTLAIVTAVTILLYCTGLELETRTEFDLDRELRVQGAANIVTACFGGFTSHITLSRTLMNYSFGTRDRWGGVVVAAVALGFAFGGMGLIGFIPKLVLCGLLLTLGVGLLMEWLVHSLRRLTTLEYVLVWVIFLTIIKFGFEVGLGAGFILGSVIFVLTYARINVIRHQFSGRDFASNLQRGPEEIGILREHGDQTRIFFLQGFIFFGMADRFYRQVKAGAFAGGEHPTRFVVLDFSAVHGIDASAASSFLKLVRAAKEYHAQVVIARISERVKRSWTAAAGAESDDVLLFEDLDRALEHTEAEILRHWMAGRAHGGGLIDWMTEALESAELAERLAAYLTPTELNAGAVLCHEGDPGDSMFFLERGRLGIYVGPEGGRMRLRSLASRTQIGEMGLYRSRARTATVIAEEPSTVYTLTREKFDELRKHDPEVMDAVNHFIVSALSERLNYGNALVVAMRQ